MRHSAFIDGPVSPRLPPRLLVAPSPKSVHRSLQLPLNSLVRMASLPSFVQLMASLGLEQRTTQAPGSEQSSSPPSSPCSIGSSAPSGPSKSSSNSSLRDAAATRHRLPRFSPYQASMVCRRHPLYHKPGHLVHMQSFTRRRSSISSISSLSDLETSPLSSV